MSEIRYENLPKSAVLLANDYKSDQKKMLQIIFV